MKSLLNIDKLTLILKSSSDVPFTSEYITEHYAIVGNVYNIPSSSIQLRRSTRLEKYYLHSFAVWVSGRHVATISTNARQKGRAVDIKLTFENHVFYTNPGWYYYLEQIKQALPLSSEGISYVEIAFDFQSDTPLLPQLAHIYRHSTFIEYNDEILYAPAIARLTCSLQHGKFYAFGTSVTQPGTSGKQIVVYNKTEEIHEHSHKEYILNYYSHNGFDITRPVERIEAKLSSKFFNSYVIFVSELNAMHNLGNIFRQAVGRTFAFRNLSERYFDNNRNYKTPIINLIDFPSLSNQPLFERPIYSNPTSDTKNRIEAKNLVQRYITHGRQQDLAQIAHFNESVSPPKGTTWPYLFRRYASEYEGKPTPDSMVRIEQFR